MDIASLIKNRLNETYTLHRRYVNPQMVRVVEVMEGILLEHFIMEVATVVPVSSSSHILHK